MKDSFRDRLVQNSPGTQKLVKLTGKMSKFDDIFKKLDRQKYPFIDGLYYLFIIIFIGILFLFFA